MNRRKIPLINGKVNTKTIAFTRLLNKIIAQVNKANNIEIRGSKIRQIDGPNGTKIIISGTRSSGGTTETTGSILYGTITEGLVYPTESDAGVATYTVTVIDPNNPSADLTEVHPLIFNQSSSSGGDDYRNYIPWYQEDEVVPILSYSGSYYFLQQMTFVGNPTEKSLSWNDSEGRAMACFK